MTRVEVAREGGKWTVTRDGIPLGSYDVKQRARTRGETAAKQAGGTLVVRNSGGEPQETETYALSTSGAGPGEVG